MPLTGGAVEFERSHDGRVANLTLDNGRFNIVTFETRRTIAERFAEIDTDASIRAVVIRGRGEHFTSGGDIAGFMEVEPVDLTDLGHDVTAASRSPKVVIVAVDGYCFGVGLELALSADIRLATSRSRFALPEMKLGMIPGSGGTQRLARFIGLSRAKYYIMTGERITGEQALDWGLVSVLSPDAPAMEKAIGSILDKILSYSPIALRTVKEVLDKGTDGPLATGIELERKSYAMLRASHDFAEGVDAFTHKRAAGFQGR